MIKLVYSPIFIRQFNKLNINLQEEVLEKVELFKDNSNHKSLKVHKLNGHLSKSYSFSVNYKYRIIFDYVTKTEVNILAIGDHTIYSK